MKKLTLAMLLSLSCVALQADVTLDVLVENAACIDCKRCVFSSTDDVWSYETGNLKVGAVLQENGDRATITIASYLRNKSNEYVQVSEATYDIMWGEALQLKINKDNKVVSNACMCNPCTCVNCKCTGEYCLSAKNKMGGCPCSGCCAGCFGCPVMSGKKKAKRSDALRETKVFSPLRLVFVAYK